MIFACACGPLRELSSHATFLWDSPAQCHIFAWISLIYLNWQTHLRGCGKFLKSNSSHPAPPYPQVSHRFFFSPFAKFLICANVDHFYFRSVTLFLLNDFHDLYVHILVILTRSCSSHNCPTALSTLSIWKSPLCYLYTKNLLEKSGSFIWAPLCHVFHWSLKEPI